METKIRKLMPLALIILMATSAVLGAVLVTRPVQISGQIVGVKDIRVYGDASCTNEVSSWSPVDLARGASESKTLYMKNMGDSTLKLQWLLPSAPPATTLTLSAQFRMAGELYPWATNSAGRMDITSGPVIETRFTLTVASTAPVDTAYTFTLNIEGTT